MTMLRFLQSKTHFRHHHTFSSISSTAADNSALQRLNLLQMNERKTWKGVKPEHTGRPGRQNLLHRPLGTCNLLNKRRFYTPSEQQKDDEERFKLLLKMLNKLADIESRKSGTRPTTTQNNFFCSSTTQASSKGTSS